MPFQAVLEPYLGYREILRASLQAALRLQGTSWSPSEGDALVAAVPAFGSFPEVPGHPADGETWYAISAIATNLV